MKRITTEELLSRIECTKAEEMEALVYAVQERYRTLYPDWEVVMLSMPAGDAAARRIQGELLIDFVRKHLLEE